MNETLDSQLSAMFDDELPGAECELLARRLSRDPALQSRWRSYAAIGAVMRGETSIALRTNLSDKVHAAVIAEAQFTGSDATLQPAARPLAQRAWQGVAGLAVAAGVAAVSVMWLRAQVPSAPAAVVADVPQSAALVQRPSGRDSYTVPAAVQGNYSAPTAELANYVFAHSYYSAPLSRRNLLSTLVASDTGTYVGPEESEQTIKLVVEPNGRNAQKSNP